MPFASISSFGQQLHLGIKGIPGDSVLLFMEGFYGEEKHAVDTVVLYRRDVVQSVPLDGLKNGLYTIHLLHGDTAMIVIGNDSALYINTTYPEMMSGKIAISGSRENDALVLLLKCKEAYQHSMDSIATVAAKIDDFDPQYETLSLYLRNALIATNTAYNEKLNQLEQLYPKTYAAVTLAPILKVAMPDATQQKQFDNLISFNHYHFFEYVPLNQKEIIANPFFEEKLKTFLTSYIHRNNYEKQKNDLVYLLDSLSENAEIKEFIRYVQIKYYLKNGPGKMIDYLLQLSEADGCESSVAFQQNTAVRNMLAMLPGRTAPQLVIRDYEGISRRMQGVLFGKKAGLVVFWSSTCAHCQDSIPALYRWYQTVRDKGVEIYAVSLDLNPDDWYNFAITQVSDWVNVSELKGWESESVSIYGVRSTPAFIVLDENQKIVLKTSSVQDAENTVFHLLTK